MAVHRVNRTIKQNSSLWKWAEMLADELNDKDMTVQFVLSQAVERVWDKDAVVLLLFKPILEHITEDGSTSKASTKDIIKTADTLADHLAMKIGIIPPPWPDRFNQMEQSK